MEVEGNAVLTGKGGRGWKIGTAGTAGKDKYLAVTIPQDQGFKVGDRVFFMPVIHSGKRALLMVKAPPKKSH
jgi:hypothetical protein